MLNCKHERSKSEREEQARDKEREDRDGRETRQLHNRNYRAFSSVPLLSPDSTQSIWFTNYMKNADIGGQMSFLIVLCMTDYLVFCLQVAITDFYFACLDSKHIVCQNRRFFFFWWWCGKQSQISCEPDVLIWMEYKKICED